MPWIVHTQHNDTDFGCTTTGNIEFAALGTGQLGMPVPNTTFGYTNKKTHKSRVNNNHWENRT